MRDDGLSRPQWVARQFLRPQDFAAAQRYHQINRWRHAIGLHSWGIACGLEIVSEAEGFTVQPGVAIDGYGRELTLTEYRTFGDEEFDRLGTTALHLWLVYRQIPVEPPPNGYAGCLQPGEPSPERTRWDEAPCVYTSDGMEEVEPRRPGGVPAGDLPFAPHRAFPVDGEPWPVYLGTVEMGENGAPAGVNLERRPYAGLVGGAIEHPAGQALVELGSESDPEIHFAVSTADARSGVLIPRIELVGPKPGVQGDTRLVLQEDVIVEGDVTIERGALWFRDSQPCDGAFSRPWQIYRCLEGTATNTLRMEFGAGSSDRFEIGRWNAEDQKFEPCLSIDRNCRVTVHGDLEVGGTMVVSRAFEQAALGRDAQKAVDATTASSLPAILQSFAAGPVEQFAAQLVALNEGVARKVRDELSIRLLPDPE